MREKDQACCCKRDSQKISICHRVHDKRAICCDGVVIIKEVIVE